MSLGRLRAGELLALVGAACVIASLLEPWYDGAAGKLDAWDTFGPAIVLLLATTIAALALALSALFERSAALPVAVGVWCVVLALIAAVAAVVRVLERPDHASSLCAGAWLALVGAIAVLLGSWLSLRDERQALYEPARPEPRERP